MIFKTTRTGSVTLTGDTSPITEGIPATNCISIKIMITFQNGIYVMYLFDWYSASFSLMIVAFLELVVVAWVYGMFMYLDSTAIF